jgi:glucose-6-phosphate 1-dehydrogenase
MDSPFVIVIFGATGDLAHNKLIPALFGMYKEKQLPKDFFIFGFARRELSDEDFRCLFNSSVIPAKAGIQEKETGSPIRSGMTNQKDWDSFSKHLFYQQGLFDSPEGYENLVKKLEDLDKKYGNNLTRIFYLATPPVNYDMILDNLKSSKLSEGCGQESNQWTRIVIEKPFGKDLETARLLDKKLSEIFEEHQIFRVDHYLGKETVQNMLVFRFANGIFDPVWNKEYIDNVQITFAEKNGINGRGKFFDGVGTLLDVGQNHLMQLIAGVAMDMPQSFSKEGLRDARAKALSAIKPIEAISSSVVRGQYKSYTEEKDVDPKSKTETFVAMKFFIDTPRFADVPFYVRAGKEMPENHIEIAIVFKQTCHILFKEVGCPEEGNILKIRIQPNEGISIQIIAKVPGSKLQLGTADMHFTYAEAYGTQGLEAYQKILMDIFQGEQMLFNRSDELESSWQFIEKIVKGWENPDVPVYIYDRQSWGPKEAKELIEKDGRKWV